jgi:hypothetical protein
MADLAQDFYRAVNSGTQWKEAFDLCNGMDMFGMLRALNSLGGPLLAEFRLRIPTYTVWGGPNMPRIDFALAVVETRTVPAAPPDLFVDQVEAARLYLQLTSNSGGPARHEATETIRGWVASRERGDDVNNRFLYSRAVPYLALGQKGQAAMTPLVDGCIGGKLGNVHGLAVHCTAGPIGPSPYGVAQNRCVNTWNGNNASAHFAIAGDGTVIQFIPTNFVANAQMAANPYWISVEVDNDGYAPMVLGQLQALKQLFVWICKMFGVPMTVATGHLCKDSGWDDITRRVCDSSNAAVSESRAETIASRGLSCHRWLDFGGGRLCPGKGMLSQLASVAKMGEVS